MPNYRRIYIIGHPIFITLVTANRNPILVNNIQYLKESITLVKNRHQFKLNAYVIMPDHCHLLITLPNNDVNFPMRVRLIKNYFSRKLPKPDNYTNNKLKLGEKGIWQRRYWDHVIRTDIDYSRHLDYIHYNPIKHKHVEHLKDWPHSSFNYFVEKGYYFPDWGSNVSDDFDTYFDVDAGE